MLVLISLLFYFFSSLRRGDQSTVFCIESKFIQSIPEKPSNALCSNLRQRRFLVKLKQKTKQNKKKQELLQKTFKRSDC